MPVEFLTDEQAESYGTFRVEPTRPELERFFFLDDEDRRLVDKRRGAHSNLGFAVQVCTVRYIGLFLADPLDVPWLVVEYLAEQLGIADPSVVKKYTERQMTPYEHAWEIEQAFGYHKYEDPEWGRKFRTFLYGRAWTHSEGPVALFNHATAWLRRHRVLLPGVSVLARQVSAARTVAEDRLHATVARAARRADPALPPALVGLLAVPEGQRRSELERLRRPPTRSTGTAMARALDRVNEISGFGLGRVNVSRVPVNRLATLARYGMASMAAALERAPEPRRTALVTAVMRNLEAAAIDDALDLFALLMATRLISPARRSSEKERLANLPSLERASRTLTRVSAALVRMLDEAAESGVALDPPLVWSVLEEIAPREQVTAAMATVDTLVPTDDGSAEIALRKALAGRYNTVRPFLTLLGESPALAVAQGGKRVLAAVRKLPSLARRKTAKRPLSPAEVDAELVPRAWRGGVREHRVARGCGRSGRLRGVRARAAAPRPGPSRRLRRAVEPLVGSASQVARRHRVGRGARGRAGRPVVGHAGGRASGGADSRAGRGMAADGRPDGRGRSGGEGRGRRPTRGRARPDERGQARLPGRTGVADLAAHDDGGDAAANRPAGPAVRGELLDRVPRRVHPRLGGLFPHGGPGHHPGGAVGRRVLQHRSDPGD